MKTYLSYNVRVHNIHLFLELQHHHRNLDQIFMRVINNLQNNNKHYQSSVIIIHRSVGRSIDRSFIKPKIIKIFFATCCCSSFIFFRFIAKMISFIINIITHTQVHITNQYLLLCIPPLSCIKSNMVYFFVLFLTAAYVWSYTKAIALS